MAGVQSVVANLKLTSKGKLVYNEKSWNSVLNETSAVPMLHIPSFVVKDTSRLLTEQKTESQDYKNYFSPERATQFKKARALTAKENDESKDQRVKESMSHIHRKLSEGSSNNLPERSGNTLVEGFGNKLNEQSSNSHVLYNIDKEYDEALKSLSAMRLAHMKSHMLHFQYEYQSQLEVIDRNLYLKHRQENHEVLNRQNMVENSEEIAYYDDVRRRREETAKAKVEQTQADLRQIQAKQKKLNEYKRALSEKKKNLDQLIESAKQLLDLTRKDYSQFKETGHTPPEDCTRLVTQMIADYQACAVTVKGALGKDPSELDRALQFVNIKFQGMQECGKKSKEILEKFKGEQEAAEKRKKEEAEAAAAAAAAANEIKAPSAPTATTTATSVSTQPTTSASVGRVPTIDQAVPALIPLKNYISAVLELLSFKPAFDSYLQLQKLLLDTEKMHKPISASKDKAIKTYKFDLYKVVNTQINAISDESPKHLMEKIMKLNNLLSEGEVMLSGKKVTVKGSPKALALVKDLIAKKLVLQGQSQVASSFKTAFPIAAVCVGLWSLFPDFGDLLLGYFYNKCPYLVPFYVPKIDDIPTMEYYKLVGYDVDDEKVEDEDKYLSKLSGTVRLYAAIMQMEIPPQLSNRPHPFGIEHGWIWFTRLMNLEPRPSVTATVIFDFLEVAGHAMMKRFGKQFQKVLLTLCQELMPKILQVTPPDSKAGAMRLKMFLESCVEKSQINPPKGVLTQSWWSSTGH